MRSAVIASLVALCVPLGAEDKPAVVDSRVLIPKEQVTPAAVEAAITKGVDFLVGKQNPDGSFGGPTRTKGLNIYAPLPGAPFRV